MTFAQHISPVSVRTATRARKKNTEVAGIEVSGSHDLLLQSHAHAVSSAACAFYLLIGDPQQMSGEQQPRQCAQDDVAERLNGVDQRGAAGPLTAGEENELIARLIAATASIASSSAQWSHCRLAPPRADLDALVGVLVAIAQETKAMVAMLQQGCSKARLLPVIAGMRALEKHGDRVCGKAMIHLQADAISDRQTLAQWWEVYASVAQSIRHCGRVAESVANLPQPEAVRQTSHRQRPDRATPQVVH